jgi:hypothetical protein
VIRTFSKTRESKCDPPPEPGFARREAHDARNLRLAQR